MGLILWHYSKGLELYIKSFENLINGIIHNFSFTTLVKTLFAPWKRLLVEERGPGFNISRFFENLTFNLISRGVGFSVRLILLISGVFILAFSSVIGIFGILIWVILPPLGLPFYLRYQKRPERYIKDILAKLAKNSSDLSVLLDSVPGKFMVAHLGIESKTLLDGAKPDNQVRLNPNAKTYNEILVSFIDAGVWSDDFLRKNNLSKEDLLFAGQWWDEKSIEYSRSADSGLFTGSGFALTLIYGYTPTLNQYSRDLTVSYDFSHHLIGREETVERIERVLSAGNSVVLTGASGVGKKTVILEFAKRAHLGQMGSKMAYRRILELDYNSLLSGSKDINEKKNLLQLALQEAAMAGNVILVVRDIHRLTNKDVEGYDFTDIFEEVLEKKELKIIAISTNIDYERFIAPNSRLRSHLEKVEVVQPTNEEALLIIRDASGDWERKKNIIVKIQAMRKILDGSEKYISETPFPEKALELLDACVELLDKEGKTVLDEDVVARILSEKTGISFARLGEKEKTVLTNLENEIHKSLVNQESAVDMIAKSLRSRTIGVAKEGKPLGSFLFLGPTGVGKTETAKVLARTYFGSEDDITRFDMSQYAGEDGLTRLIGSKDGNWPGDLSTSIKNKPANLLLLDEIEKAGSKAHNLLLTILDEGYLVDVFGKKINCQHLFIIGTSNAAAAYIWELVKKGVRAQELHDKVVTYVVEKGMYSPEFLNRFDGVIVFEPLTPENLVKIARLMYEGLRKSLKTKGIELEIGEDLISKLANDGYDPSFGARPMRRIIDLTIGDLVGKALLEGKITDGDAIRIIPGNAKDEYSLEKLPNAS